MLWHPFSNTSYALCAGFSVTAELVNLFSTCKNIPPALQLYLRLKMEEVATVWDGTKITMSRLSSP